jgi:hypothetical protein
MGTVGGGVGGSAGGGGSSGDGGCIAVVEQISNSKSIYYSANKCAAPQQE